MPPFARVLVANRGEIAVRIFRTLRELGVETVAVYSEADRGALHTRVADEAFLIGPPPPAESYLVIERLLATARRAGAEAIHPGYGFLAENASFARAVEDAGLVWIGPPPEAIELMGTKTAARAAMQAAGVPVVPGTVDPVESADDAIRIGNDIGWPIALKAAAGGGGKGLKLVSGPDEAAAAFESAQREGQAYFADPTVYVERYLDDPRHVEVQVLADAHGNVIHLGERECTIQRRHQKLVEETPSPAVDDALRARIGAIAVDAARAAGYRSAGTIEGLLSQDGEYYFLEMNTRIQVEHTVTELVTGLDLVREQVLIAAGEPLSPPSGRRLATRPCDRVPHQCRGSLDGIPACSRADRELPRAGGAGRARGLRCRGGDGGGAVLRPTARQACRPRGRPRARAEPHAPRARGVRDRRSRNAARLPSRASQRTVLRRGRHVRGDRRVGGARREGEAVVSSDNDRSGVAGRGCSSDRRAGRAGRTAVRGARARS